MTAQANIGVIGLAAMGSNLARNLAHHGNTVALFNRHYSRTEKLIAEHGIEGIFVPAKTMEEFAASLQRPRTAIIMVKAGAPTDAVIKQLEEVFEPGDIIVDGGNSYFKDTIKREKEVRAAGFHFVGCGVSGGEEGALNGPSLMPGGTAESWKTLGPILESIAAKVDGEPCATHIGTDGAGHFVKMVHNGIEYADMQVIGEAYDILRRGLGLFPEAIGDVFADWNKGDLDSYLIEITADILHEKDERTGKPLVDVVVDQAGMKGTGTWTVQTALEFGSPVTGIGEAVFARALSSHPELRQAAQENTPAGPMQRKIRRPSSRMCVVHCSLPRSSPILKDLMRSKTVPSSTAGISTWEPLPRSGAAAALSERNSSTASPTPTPMGTRLPWHLIRISPSSLPMPRIPGAESSRPPLMQVFRHLCSPAL